MSEPKRKRVLIVEDTDSVQLMVKHWLTGNGYDVDLASDGKEALDHVKDNVPDLILLDIMMPELNGYAVCRKLREMQQTRKTPVIIITALPTAVDSDEGKLSGANEVILKPLNREDLLRRIRSYLGSVFA
ncbi:MAG TPA: response regulator transcription factor [Bacteroidota bacterium]|nr:response regulator transcription factor [Bacteroidota bacterium]